VARISLILVGISRPFLIAIIVAILLSAHAMAAARATAASAWHVTVRDFAREHFKNPAWGYSHSMRDYALARDRY
jgi:uncharacterized protein